MELHVSKLDPQCPKTTLTPSTETLTCRGYSSAVSRSMVERMLASKSIGPSWGASENSSEGLSVGLGVELFLDLGLVFRAIRGNSGIRQSLMLWQQFKDRSLWYQIVAKLRA